MNDNPFTAALDAKSKDADWLRFYLLALDVMCVDMRELAKANRKPVDPWGTACKLADDWQAAADKHHAQKAAAPPESTTATA